MWAGGAIALAGAIALGLLSVVMGLNKANELAGVVSASATLVGLGVSMYGLVLARRTSSPPSRPSSYQSVTGSTVLGGVVQVDGVVGGVNAGVAPPSVAPDVAVMPAPGHAAPTAPAAATSSAAHGSAQSVTNSQIGGNVTQISGVGGDVDVSQ